MIISNVMFGFGVDNYEKEIAKQFEFFLQYYGIEDFLNIFLSIFDDRTRQKILGEYNESKKKVVSNNSNGSTSLSSLLKRFVNLIYSVKDFYEFQRLIFPVKNIDEDGIDNTYFNLFNIIMRKMDAKLKRKLEILILEQYYIYFKKKSDEILPFSLKEEGSFITFEYDSFGKSTNEFEAFKAGLIRNLNIFNEAKNNVIAIFYLNVDKLEFEKTMFKSKIFVYQSQVSRTINNDSKSIWDFMCFSNKEKFLKEINKLTDPLLTKILVLQTKPSLENPPGVDKIINAVNEIFTGANDNIPYNSRKAA